MKKTRYVALVLLSSLLTLVGCSRREILDDYPVTGINIRLDWEGVTGRLPEGVRVIFYPKDAQGRKIDTYLPAKAEILTRLLIFLNRQSFFIRRMRILPVMIIGICVQTPYPVIRRTVREDGRMWCPDTAGTAVLFSGISCGNSCDTALGLSDADSCRRRYPEGRGSESVRAAAGIPLFMKKQIRLEDETLIVTETIRNEGGEPADFTWTQHSAFGGSFLDEQVEKVVLQRPCYLPHKRQQPR